MKKNLIIYILSFLGFIAFSCNDEAFIANTGENGEEGDGLTLSLKIDVPQTRTRAIDMTPGGALYLNNIWVGVFDRTSGNRVLSDSVNLHSRLTESGVTLTDVIKIKVNGWSGISPLKDYCVVGVANYYGIKAYDNKNKDLITALEDATNWDSFINISIDSQQEIPNQTPVLMGYLTNKNQDETKHTVIDQLSNNRNNKINLANQTDVYVKGNTTGTGFVTKNYVMNLRRLRSKININLKTRDEQMTITNLEYKVVNVPRSSFLAERSTLVSPTNYTSSYSPNSADVKNEGYITLDDLNKLENEGWQKTTDNYSFSYEHVENKHWARSGAVLSDYHSRGLQDETGVFTNLATKAEDWNNNASYVILRISLRDFKDGRNSTIEYTITEGFCNDADGVSQVGPKGETTGSLDTRLKDFSCFRNTDYNYNIDIKSVEEIYTTVTTSGDNHPYDQHNGNIWQMKYPEFKSSDAAKVTDNRITVTNDASLTFLDPIDCKIDEDNKPVAFEDIGFRLAGSFYDAKRGTKVPVDLCYNVAHSELDGFSGLWIDPINGVTEYFVNTTTEDTGEGSTGSTALEAMNKYLSEGHADVDEMLSRFTVNADGNNNRNLKITEFIEKLRNGEVTKITGVNVKGIRLYETAEESDGPRNHMIGLYIFDRQRSIEKGDRVKTDKDGDCHYFQIRAIEQYPAYSKAIYERIYALDNNGNRMTSKGGTTQQINNRHNDIQGGKNMIFSENPDLAFRLVGYYDKDGSGEFSGHYDLCYNFDINEYPWFNQEDMPAVSYDTKSISKTALTRENIPTELLDGIKIQDARTGQTYNIKQFISRALAGNITPNTDYRVVFSSYGKKYYENTETERNNSIRGIYIFEKKDRYKKPVIYNESTNEATYQIYAAEQDGIYVPPTKLPLPTIRDIVYNHTATYNIIEQFVGEIKVPLLDNYTYNQDYYYRLYTLDDNGSSLRECKLEQIKSQSNGIATFYVPMSIAHANARNIYIQTKKISNRLLDSEESNSVGRTGTLINPEWDFRDNNWNVIYRSKHFVDVENESKYRNFTNNVVEFSGGYNVPPITFSAPGNNVIRGSIQTGNGYININNSGASVIINIYRSCNVKEIIYGPNGSTNDRGITITSEYFNTTLNYSNSQLTSSDIRIPNDNGEHLQVSFSITGGQGNIYKIRLTD